VYGVRDGRRGSGGFSLAAPRALGLWAAAADPVPGGSGSSRSPVGTRFENEAHEARLELNLEAIGVWTGAIGVQASQRDLVAIGEEAFVPANQTDDLGLFLIERAGFGPWSVEAGLRYDQQDVVTDLARADHDAVSFSLAGLYEINAQWQWSISVDRAERAPTAEELFSFGPHIATQSFEVGNAALDTETAQQAHRNFKRSGL
jgi:iron complex outermembrane receptor protein